MDLLTTKSTFRQGIIRPSSRLFQVSCQILIDFECCFLKIDELEMVKSTVEEIKKDYDDIKNVMQSLAQTNSSIMQEFQNWNKSNSHFQEYE